MKYVVIRTVDLHAYGVFTLKEEAYGFARDREKDTMLYHAVIEVRPHREAKFDIVEFKPAKKKI